MRMRGCSRAIRARCCRIISAGRPIQGLEQRFDHEPSYAPLVSKPHLSLGGVHIHIQRMRFNLEEEERQRIPPLGDIGVVAFD